MRRLNLRTESFGISHVGVYGACSTMALTLGLAACFADRGLCKLCGGGDVLPFCASERQFRLPLEYGGQRAGSTQWTVTGAGALLVARGRGKSQNKVGNLR